MPFPASDIAWPPRPHELVFNAAREQQVWWEGDPDKLAQFYGGQHAAATVNASAGRLARAWQAFWAKPQATNDPKRLHVPVAADLGRIAAGVLFGEPPTWRAADGNQAVQDAADLILNTDDLASRLLVAAESAAMLSGTYGRIVWNGLLRKNVWIDFVDADRAIPTFQWGILTEVTFASLLPSDDGRIVWRHLERHAPGVVENALYSGSATAVGSRRPLTEHPATAGMKEQVPTGVTELTAAYFPHHRPNAAWRDVPELAPLGRPDLTRPVIHLLDACDRTWSSWMRDLDLGRGRLIVSEQLMNIGKAGSGSEFDLDRAIFSPVGAAMTAGDMTTLLEGHQFDIRVQEHQQTFEALLRQIIAACGYSPLTFGLADEAAQTATEVDAKERDTNSTRATRVRLWTPSLAELGTTALRVNARVFGTVAPEELLNVDFPPMHQQSQKQVAETTELLHRASAISTEMRVRRVNPDWDDGEVAAEVQRIQDESGSVLPPMPDEGNQGDPFAGPAVDPAADPGVDGVDATEPDGPTA
ncbi:phage portal protein [Tsukamurella sp. NPDC003166]|uniref:phage portal protein n=1 Tax=Tsukamurella sp. NPDC003166 TaxID=3154444 RepID=UPI0033A6356D